MIDASIRKAGREMHPRRMLRQACWESVMMVAYLAPVVAARAMAISSDVVADVDGVVKEVRSVPSELTTATSRKLFKEAHLLLQHCTLHLVAGCWTIFLSLAAQKGTWGGIGLPDTLRSTCSMCHSPPHHAPRYPHPKVPLGPCLPTMRSSLPGPSSIVV